MREEILTLGEDVLEQKLEELGSMSVENENYRKTESTVYNLFDKLNDAEKLEIERSDRDAQRENDAERNTIEEADKAERRRIEEERNEMQASIEMEKQKISWKRVLFEMSKVIAPVLISGAIFAKVHEENMEFEQTGSFHSSTGRGLNGSLLNRFLKF